MAKGKRRKERIRALKLAARGADARMDGDAAATARGGGDGTTTTTTARATTATTTATATTDGAGTTRAAPGGGRKRAPTVRRAIAKRKSVALDKALSHVERRGVKADRKRLKRGHRVAARDVY